MLDCPMPSGTYRLARRPGRVPGTGSFRFPVPHRSFSVRAHGLFRRVWSIKIRAFVDGWNDRSHPFVWTKTAEEILKKANRPTTSNPRH